MAPTLDFLTAPAVINVTYEDNTGATATTTHYPPAGTAYADLINGQQGLVNALDAFTSSRIKKVQVIFEAENTDAVKVASPDSDVKDKLHLSFEATNKRANYSFDLPSPLPSAEQVGTQNANVAQATLAALITATVSGGWGPNNGLRTATGFDLVKVKKAFYNVRTRQAPR